jgi:CRISPR-associated protein (TIGR03986 family)
LKFHNPYHFVPVKPERRSDDLTRVKFLEGGHHVTHDRYVRRTLSGRLICRLTTASPIFVGAKRDPSENEQTPSIAEPFELPGEEGKPAIPASSLRGLISSVAEAASNSALRVLEARPYSYRVSMEKALSALGIVLMRQDERGETRPFLLPLALPTIPFRVGNSIVLPSPFRQQHFAKPTLRVFIGNKESIRTADFPQTFRWDDQQFYGMKLATRSWIKNGEVAVDNSLKIKGGSQSKFLIGQEPLDRQDPILWEDIPEAIRPQYTRGIIRSLGCYGRDIPPTKKHELFIPFPDKIDEALLLAISNDALERFYDLADQRTDEDPTLPYEPQGTARNLSVNNDKDHTIRLKQGDLVFFVPDPVRNQVDRISFSSIWRDRVEIIESGKKSGATAHTFFRQVNEALVPFDSRRQLLTIAEQLFGFVQQEKNTESKGALALAGRVWFSTARWEGDEGDQPYEEPITLRILDSPKPPSPAIYFKKASGKPAYVSKSMLSPKSHHPQGRKFYLHRSERDGEKPWGTADSTIRAKQKVTIKPVKAQSVFYFHLDFVNLSSIELGLLLFALKPSEGFRHKLGMGKSIGLGTVNITPVGLFEVDRETRYSPDGLFSQRYGRAWIAGSGRSESWPDQYVREKSDAAESEVKEIESIKVAFTDTLDPDIRVALELIGDPANLKVSVHTPLIQDGEREDKTFRWFVANDQGSGKGEDRLEGARRYLEPLSRASNVLPDLDALEWRGE